MYVCVISMTFFSGASPQACTKASEADSADDLTSARNDAVKKLEAAQDFQQLSSDEQVNLRTVIESRMAREFGTVQETKAIGRKESDDLLRSTQQAVRAAVKTLDVSSPAHVKELEESVMERIATIPQSGFDGTDVSAGEVAKQSQTISTNVFATVKDVIRDKQAQVGLPKQSLETFEVRQDQVCCCSYCFDSRGLLTRVLIVYIWCHSQSSCQRCSLKYG